MTIEEVLLKTDWKLLREQKVKVLSYSIEPNEHWDDFEALDGIIAWIDCIQDAAIVSGIASEEEVFGELSDD